MDTTALIHPGDIEVGDRILDDGAVARVVTACSYYAGAWWRFEVEDAGTVWREARYGVHVVTDSAICADPDCEQALYGGEGGPCPVHDYDHGPLHSAARKASVDRVTLAELRAVIGNPAVARIREQSSLDRYPYLFGTARERILQHVTGLRDLTRTDLAEFAAGLLDDAEFAAVAALDLADVPDTAEVLAAPLEAEMAL